MALRKPLYAAPVDLMSGSRSTGKINLQSGTYLLADDFDIVPLGSYADQGHTGTAQGICFSFIIKSLRGTTTMLNSSV